MAMGFSRDKAVTALVQCDNNLDAALASLLRQSSGGDVTNASTSPSLGNANNDARSRMARAAESRAQNWRQNSAVSSNSSSRVSADVSSSTQRPTVVNAGLGEDAALQKALQESLATNTTSSVAQSSNIESSFSLVEKRITPISSGPSAKGLKRLAKVIAPHAVAMDTLIKIINMILQNPGNPKFRRLKWTNKRVKDTIKDAPGATDFLKLLGFVDDSATQSMVLSPSNADEAVLLQGLQLLEAQRNGNSYRSAVNNIEFNAVMSAVLGRAPDAVEATKRQAYTDKLPALPAEKEGTNTNLRVKLGEHYVTRRFRTDNTLQAAIDFLGSLSSIVPGKLLANEWKLVNSTTFPARDVDLKTDLKRTFYALDMWPSAELTLEPMPIEPAREVKRMGSGVVIEKSYA